MATLTSTQGVLDYGYVAAGKTGGNAANDPMGRRVFFGWNMPWSRQGAYPAEGPWRRRLQQAEAAGPAAPAWPIMEAFGSQVRSVVGRAVIFTHPLWGLHNIIKRSRLSVQSKPAGAEVACRHP